MSLLGLRTAIVTSLQLEVASLTSVAAHGGRINLAEVRRAALNRAPAGLVTVLGGPIEREGGGGVGVCDAQVVVFIICLGTSQVHRDAEALALAEAVAVQAIRNSWAYDGSKAPAGIRVDNLYNGTQDRDGFALWSVTWTQRLDVGYDTSVDDLDDFNRLHADWDLAPRDGVADASQDVWLQGTLMSAYGQLHVSTSAATPIAVVDTYQKVAGTTTLKSALAMDMPTDGRLRHTGSVSRPMLVEAAVSIEVDGDATVTVTIAKNGTADADVEVTQECVAGAGAEAFSVPYVGALDENDYVEVWAKADDTVNVTATKLSLVAVAT
jgi:hypothetical protein